MRSWGKGKERWGRGDYGVKYLGGWDQRNILGSRGGGVRVRG